MLNVEILAWIIIVFVGLKLAVLLFMGPKDWLNFVKTLLSDSGTTRVVTLLVMGVTGWYLFEEVSIVTFLACAMFLITLLCVGFQSFSKELLEMSSKLLKKPMSKLWARSWLYTLIWVLLLVWGVKELLG